MRWNTCWRGRDQEAEYIKGCLNQHITFAFNYLKKKNSIWREKIFTSENFLLHSIRRKSKNSSNDFDWNFNHLIYDRFKFLISKKIKKKKRIEFEKREIGEQDSERWRKWKMSRNKKFIFYSRTRNQVGKLSSDKIHSLFSPTPLNWSIFLFFFLFCLSVQSGSKCDCVPRKRTETDFAFLAVFPKLSKNDISKHLRTSTVSGVASSSKTNI